MTTQDRSSAPAAGEPALPEQAGQADAVISDAARRYLRLHLTTDVGPVRLRNLITHFGSIEAAMSASMAELQRVDGVGPRVAKAVFKSRGDDGSVEAEVERAAACNVRILCLEDAEYPQSLRNICDPPTCLYVRGRLKPTDGVAVAIVGTRRCSHYGREQAIRFGEMLGGAGFTVVSGLARGVDGDAHRGAMQAGGRTIAVLGNGLSRIYPAEHEALAAQIENAGAVVSEFAVDVGPEARNFPRRNRIIAGLSLGVVVIEAGRKSGALITARLATEYNREVFALPGRVDQPESTAGVHGLIRDGQAKLITCLDDILDELDQVGEIMRRETQQDAADSNAEAHASAPLAANLSASERAVFDAVGGGAEDVDTVASRAGLDSAGVLSALTSLQIKGLIRQLPGGRFAPRVDRSPRRHKD